MRRDLYETFIIVGAPPERDKTVILGLLQNQKTAVGALRTYHTSDRPDKPNRAGWLVQAIPMYPVDAMDRAIGQFFIDAGQPPGPAVIEPLVRHFREEIMNAIERSLGIPPLSKSKWGRR